MLILAAVLAIFVYGMISATLGTILPDLSGRLSLTPRQNGTIAFAQALGLMIASLLVGPLMDRAGQKAGLVLGLSIATIALLQVPRSGRYASTAALFFALGVGGGMITTGGNALASSVGEARRAITLNLVNLFFGLGGLATPFLSANLLGKNSTRLCYLMAVITGVTLLIHAATPMPAPAVAQTFELSEAGAILGKPILFLVAFFLFLYVGCEVGIWNWLPRYLIAQGIPESRALNILSLGFALGLLSGRIAVAPVLIQVSAIWVMLAASAAMAVTTFWMLQSRKPAAAGILVFLAGVSMAPVYPTALAVVGDTFPRMAATALGIVVASGWLGLAVSSRVIGTIAGGDPKRLRRALMVIPASSIAMIAVALAIRAAQG